LIRTSAKHCLLPPHLVVMLALAASVLSAFGAFLFGLDIGYIAPIISSDEFKKDVVGGALTPVIEGLIVSIFSIGCIISSLPFVSGYFMTCFGRRDTIIIGALIFSGGCMLQGCAVTLVMMLTGRLVAGVSIGLLSTVVALYQSEVAAPHMRGTLTSLYQLNLTLGILVATFADKVLVHKTAGWRLAILLQLIPALFLFMGMPFLPRSPSWLVLQGRREEARAALVTLRGDPAVAEKELESIVDSASRIPASSQHVPLSNLAKGLTGRLAALGLMLQLLQQFVGMNAFMYYGPTMFKDVGLDADNFQVYTNFCNFLATFVAVLFADSFGRRSLLTVGAVGQLVPCVVLALVGNVRTLDASGAVMAPGWVMYLMPAMVFTFVASFAASWGPIVWVYTAEIYPLRYRAWCMGVSTTANWVGNYAIAQLTPMLFGRLHFNTFWIFAIFCGVALLLARELPETKGVPLEEINAVFAKKFNVTDEEVEEKIDATKRQPLLKNAQVG